MSALVSLAADPRPPLEGDVLVDTGVGIVSVTMSITSARGRYITVQNTGTNPLAYLFGNATSSVDPTAEAGLTRCMILQAGESRDFRYDKGLTFVRAGVKHLVTHIAYRATAGTTDLRIVVS